jgi:hypothetical protein
MFMFAFRILLLSQVRHSPFGTRQRKGARRHKPLHGESLVKMYKKLTIRGKVNKIG